MSATSQQVKVPQFEHPVLRTIARLSELCGAIAAGLLLAAVLITCQMIWVRTVSNQSTVWQTETVIYLMVSATLIGLPYVQRLRGHVNVDLLPMLLPLRARRMLAIVTLSLVILVIAVMLFYAAELWLLASSRGWTSDTVWRVPLWIPYLALPVGFGLYLLQLVADLYAVIAGHEAPFSLEPTPEPSAAQASPAGLQAAPLPDAAEARALSSDQPPGPAVPSNPTDTRQPPTGEP